MTDDRYLWDRSGEPDADIERLEELLAPFAHDASRSAASARKNRRRALPPILGLAAAVLVLIGGGWWLLEDRAPQHWKVTWLHDTAGMLRRLRVGEWLETPGDAQARLHVARIGTVDLAGDTRIRLKRTGRDEHRIELARGRIDAFITAPPRLFIVDTPAVTAVDLGCAYRLEVEDDAGNGRLEVTAGFVSLETGDWSAFVPSGAECAIRQGRGPGTPYFGTSSEALRAAVARLDSDPTDGAALDTLLQEAQASDTLSLYHLMPFLGRDERERVLDRIEALATLPEDADRDRLVDLDRRAMADLQDELRLYW